MRGAGSIQHRRKHVSKLCNLFQHASSRNLRLEGGGPPENHRDMRRELVRKPAGKIGDAGWGQEVLQRRKESSRAEASVG